MQYVVRLDQLAPIPLAVVRRQAAQAQLSKVVPDCCGIVWNVLRTQKISGAGRHVALYWDDVINVEVGVELDTPFAGHGDVVSSATPAGAVATTTHFGPYGKLGDAHKAVVDWCTANGHVRAGPLWEIYGHWVDAWNNDPSLIRTDVFHLLKPGSASVQ
jgi:effector-binding domain-containing protein